MVTELCKDCGKIQKARSFKSIQRGVEKILLQMQSLDSDFDDWLRSVGANQKPQMKPIIDLFDKSAFALSMLHRKIRETRPP